MDRSRHRRFAAAAAASLVLLSASCTDGGESPDSAASTGPAGDVVGARTTVAQDLDVPWGVAFLPDRSALVTLRDKADVVAVSSAGAAPMPVGHINGVSPDGEGGLLGIAVSPRFASDRRVFVYYTTESDNRVQRFTLDEGRLRAGPVVVQGIPRAGFHDGGRIAFGPDGQLYVGTGDAGERDRAQDRSNLGGKILRVDQDGRPPSSNPFPGSPVWSLGHRNVQGLAWDTAGRMFATEFGQNTWDELNLVRPGANYGWPRVEGRAGQQPYVDPLVQWRTSDASPSGLAIGPDGAAYIAALAGRTLWRVPLAGAAAGEPQRLLHEEVGRIRTVVVAPDRRLWVVTSNTFRGSPRDGDDRILALTVRM
ncbi:PQQ-dependent sugar dehydrogenase [Luteipulveratus flavus]|uniref:PQQ-dependent sugar dehydrogenase n=1 Tax=Luteipulveratus flavus TaxID=3031728 RepID=A0ABT6CBK0_9MICO|nr:PQQ-dependent sugar dehydrogenase [Luteipulveratus sp. YIM 133296]MDF8265434.1 PQQ-dependent sugar dehydrogenase [Luteipulveratus sp. YIM 133296]